MTCRHGTTGTCTTCQTALGGLYHMPDAADPTKPLTPLQIAQQQLVELAMGGEISYRTYLDAVEYVERFYAQP